MPVRRMAPRWGMKVSELTEEEFRERCMPLRNVTIGEIETSYITNVYIEGDTEVKKVRIHPESEEWFREHKDQTIDMEVFPYNWEFGDRSGTIYYFAKAKMKES
jgi:hypothetical protein